MSTIPNCPACKSPRTAAHCACGYISAGIFPPIDHKATAPPNADDTPRQKPFVIPWTWGEWSAVRYLAGARRLSLDAIGHAALARGLQELARETVADHNRRRKNVPQRLALLARGEMFKAEERSNLR